VQGSGSCLGVYMGERLTNRVRIEESHRGLRALQRRIDAWADQRHQLDSLGQYGAHVTVLESVLVQVLGALAGALDGIDAGRPVGEVYMECRRADDNAALVSQIWEWFRVKFEQRGDAVFGPLLAAADEVLWSCYAGVFRNAAALSGRAVPHGLVPLPFIELGSRPTVTPQDVTHADLRPSRELTTFLRRLPLPVIALPLAWVEAPWWLLLLSHEVGHQIQRDLVPEDRLHLEFAELIATAAASGGAEAAVRWRGWSEEIFADLCLLCIGGPWGIWSVVEQALADERTMLAAGRYPSTVARLELLASAATALGTEGHAGLRGVDPRALAAVSQDATSDVALAPLIAAQALGHRFDGLGSLAELFAFDPSDFQPGGTVHRWAKALRAPGAHVGVSSLRSGRMIACGAVAAYSSIAVINDDVEREHARAMLGETLLNELARNRERGVRDSPTAVSAFTLGPSPLVGELRRETAVPDIRPIVSDLSQLLAGISRVEARLGRIETSISEIAKVSGIVHDQLRKWTLSYEAVSGTPRLFTLTPVSKRGLDKAAVWQDTYRLTLWCEHDDQPHPWKPAQYQFNRTRDWLITIAPYALGVLNILRLAVSISVPVGTLANSDLGSIKDDLEAMNQLLDQVPKQISDASTVPGQTAQSIQADGPELRALRALLTELDPDRTFKGMHVAAAPSGDIRWVCQDHYPMYSTSESAG
jgi:hypothetical protein